MLLTGGVGSGKTALANRLARELGKVASSGAGGDRAAAVPQPLRQLLAALERPHGDARAPAERRGLPARPRIRPPRDARRLRTGASQGTGVPPHPVGRGRGAAPTGDEARLPLDEGAGGRLGLHLALPRRAGGRSAVPRRGQPLELRRHPPLPARPLRRRRARRDHRVPGQPRAAPGGHRPRRRPADRGDRRRHGRRPLRARAPRGRRPHGRGGRGHRGGAGACARGEGLALSDAHRVKARVAGRARALRSCSASPEPFGGRGRAARATEPGRRTPSSPRSTTARR